MIMSMDQQAQLPYRAGFWKAAYGRVGGREVTGRLSGGSRGGEEFFECRVTDTDSPKQQEKSNDDHKYLPPASFPASASA